MITLDGSDEIERLTEERSRLLADHFRRELPAWCGLLFLSITLLFVAVVSLSSCAVSNPLIGTWRDASSSPTASSEAAFGADGSFGISTTGQGVCSGTLRVVGRYSAAFSSPTTGLFVVATGSSLCGGSLSCRTPSGGLSTINCAVTSLGALDGVSVTFALSNSNTELRLPFGGFERLTRAQ